MANDPRASYDLLSGIVSDSGDLKGDIVSDALSDVIMQSLAYLGQKQSRLLTCDDPQKEYFSFTSGKHKSRPVNKLLFSPADAAKYSPRVLNCDLTSIEKDVLERTLYTMAVAYCAVADLLGKGSDKKTPGTFFEVLIGHLVGRMFGVNPKNSIEVQSLDISGSLPTDFTFDLGPGRNKIHMPVKTSTRERVIQVWAHQRVIDGVFGVGRFKGILVCLAETNAKPGFGVTEVCLPGQWTIYQMFIAQLHRVYYFDVPKKYAELASAYPFIQVKTFASFFSEAETLAKAAPFS